MKVNKIDGNKILRLSNRESWLEKRFGRWVKKKGGFFIKMEQGEGLPDRLVILPFIPPYFVEFKKPKVGFLSALQESVQKNIQEIGCLVVHINSGEILVNHVEQQERRLNYLEDEEL